jgi:hypothetical protein
MPSAAPAEEAVELYNQLLHLPPAQSEQVRTLLWKLKGLHRKLPGNPAVTLALIEAQRLAGDAHDALVLANAVWPLVRVLNRQERDTYISHLMSLGLYEKALELVTPELENASDSRRRRAFTSAYHCAWNLGRLEHARFLLNDMPGGERKSWMAVIHEIEKNGLATHFASHQKVIRDALAGKQTMSQLGFGLTGDGDFLTSTNYAFMAEDYDGRLAVEESVLKDLQTYYSGHGLAEAPWWDLMMLVVLPLSSSLPEIELARRSVA